MKLCLPQHLVSSLAGLRECLERWSTMQSSTETYIENAQHDLQSSNARPELGCLDPSLGPEIRACYLESAEKMLRSLRVAIETFDKVVDSLGVLEASAKESSDLYAVTLFGWIKDVRRMFAAETAHKRLILSLLGSGLDDQAIELHVSRWIEQPMINKSLIEKILKLS